MNSVQRDDGGNSEVRSLALYRVLYALGALAPGESLEISSGELREIGDTVLDGFAWTALDIIMSGPVENAFCILPATPDPGTGAIRFTRKPYSTHKGDLRTWVAPDKRDEFAQRADGYWEWRTLSSPARRGGRSRGTNSQKVEDQPWMLR